jgi:DNA-binding IclR family transcriptional regulator
VFGPGGVPIAGLSVAMPTARYRRARLPELVSELARSSTCIEADLVTMAQDWPPPLATIR